MSSLGGMTSFFRPGMLKGALGRYVFSCATSYRLDITAIPVKWLIKSTVAIVSHSSEAPSGVWGGYSRRPLRELFDPNNETPIQLINRIARRASSILVVVAEMSHRAPLLRRCYSPNFFNSHQAKIPGEVPASCDENRRASPFFLFARIG
ncbi:hypothetical protein CLV93_10345 [Prolixibacter denitrificans]|uniref:Uncharacterized protein n=1 Tax=Prolixibacter denitrificans TaxID=1541063 RepID=A0A2P8CF65_9BACT|nr:hypothetical protein CLV93_10345 [Prolixibacter denitrificans]